MTSRASGDEARLGIGLFVDGIRHAFGHDFRGYARPSLERRIAHACTLMEARDPPDLLARVLGRPERLPELLHHLTVPTTEMFRDPPFWAALRTEVVPILRTFPSLNVWHAGCATGEEVISCAILFLEEGLLDRTTFHATDLSPRALGAAATASFRLPLVRGYTRNYHEAGGREVFSRYYTVRGHHARFDPTLLRHTTFADHNLVTDQVFAEVHLLLCRNVLIYFDRGLQERAIGLFADALRHQCFLALGTRESVRFVPSGPLFDDFQPKLRIYRRNLRPSANPRDPA